MAIDIDVLRDADRRAVEATVAVVARCTVADLAKPTPCGDWNVAELLAHMGVQQHGFAESAAGGGAELAGWRPTPLGEQAVTAYTAACSRVLDAFAVPDLAERSFALPEIRDGGPFPARLAVGFHLVDNVVHAWDVASALGVDPALDDDLVRLALRIAEAVPDGPERQDANAAFAPALPVPDDAAPLDRVLLLLGRTPQ
ncbi:MAG: TIGR03086 family metal-binding protein [Actinomycetota bacterium]|nr:TIGR03086 family metal-binding protein [Actinomycetota bacterium]